LHTVATKNVLPLTVAFLRSYDTSVATASRIDLAILQLIQPFTLSTQVQAIALCGNAGPSASGVPLSKVAVANCFPVTTSPVTSVWVSGYGVTITGDSSSTSNTLNYARLQTISQSRCAQVWNTNFGCSNCLPATNVCAGSNPATAGDDACFGDSGGPLVPSQPQ
jgi:secreted trypsin-like serine protease